MQTYTIKWSYYAMMEWHHGYREIKAVDADHLRKRIMETHTAQTDLEVYKGKRMIGRILFSGPEWIWEWRVKKYKKNELPTHVSYAIDKKTGKLGRVLFDGRR